MGWLWCRVNDNLYGGSSQCAGVGVVDIRAAEAEAAENGTGVKSAEMELELLAREPSSQGKLGELNVLAACQAKPLIDEDDDMFGDSDEEEPVPKSRKPITAGASRKPPPGTDRNFVERYIVRKYGGSTFFDSYQCAEASRTLVRELADL